VSNLDVPEQIYEPYTPGPLTVNIAQDANTAVPTLTAGSAGTSTVSLDTKLTAALQFRKKDGSYTPWTFNCTVKANPVQNRAFSPSVTITP
jgi:hypothetical protein